MIEKHEMNEWMVVFIGSRYFSTISFSQKSTAALCRIFSANGMYINIKSFSQAAVAASVSRLRLSQVSDLIIRCIYTFYQ